MPKVLILLLILLSSVFSHPHTFIEIYPKINHNKNIITTIHLDWKFDAMTSQLLLMEFDQNMDGKIDNEENKYVFTNFFEPLGDYGFYTDIRIDQKATIAKAENFKASIDNEQRIVYSFDVEINTPKNKLYIDFYDEESFTAFVLKEEFVTSGIPFEVVDVDNDFYFTYRLKFKE